MSDPPDKSTLLLDGLSSPAKTSPPAHAASYSQREVLSPTPLNNKRKPTDPPSADAEDDDSAALDPLSPLKRARGRPKGSTKKVQAETEANTGRRTSLRGMQPPISEKAALTAHETPRKRGRPKGTTTGTKASKSDGVKKRGRPKKTVIGMKSSAAAEAEEGMIEKTAGVRKRGRPKKQI
ncbi:MAG: hypothetical protein Q9171_001788 [Xanthocarpia ochracea]